MSGSGSDDRAETFQDVRSIAFDEDSYTPEGLERFEGALEAIYSAEDGPFILLLDLCSLPPWPPPNYIWEVGQFLHHHRQDIASKVEFSVISVSSPSLRFIVEQLFQLVPPQRPVFFHTDPERTMLDLAIEVKAREMISSPAPLSPRAN